MLGDLEISSYAYHIVESRMIFFTVRKFLILTTINILKHVMTPLPYS